VGRQSGIIYITTFRTKEPPFEFFFGFVKEGGVFGTPHRPELVQVQHRYLFDNLVVIPFLVFHTYGIIMIFDVLPFVPLRFQKNGTGVHIPGQAFFIHHMIQIIFPIQPVFEAFVGKCNTVLRGVVGPYNTQAFIPLFCQFVCDGSPDDSGSDDNGIKLFVHDLLLSRLVLSDIKR